MAATERARYNPLKPLTRTMDHGGRKHHIISLFAQLVYFLVLYSLQRGPQTG
jgi:hypothetical protein